MLNNCPICKSKPKLNTTSFGEISYYAISCSNENCRLFTINTLPSLHWKSTIEEAANSWNYLLDDNSSDGYHTFGELYLHRTALFLSLANTIAKVHPEYTFKSKKHDNGEMFDEYFIAGILTENGWITYHQELKYWDKFKVPELPNAPKWDGHTSNDVVDRLLRSFA